MVTASPWPRRSTVVRASFVGVAVGLVALELASAHFGYRGPSQNFLRDFVCAPKRGPVLWAALALAMVGLDWPARWRCAAIAVAVDVAFLLGRLPGGGRVTFGNGAAFVTAAIGGWALWRWQGERREATLRGVVLGAVMVMASKVSDSWLHITAITQRTVLDEYLQTADHALGNPSSWAGHLVQATGGPGHLLLQTVYIELPVAAMAVAAYQLRKGWPAHHLVRTFILIGLVGPICYLMFPVVGPVYAFGSAGKGWAAANVWPSVPSIGLHPGPMAFDSLTPRNCMPSLHTAWAVAIFVHTRIAPRWMRKAGTFWLVATLIATLGFGYHYGVDLVAGVVFGLTIEAALRDPERGWGWFRVRLVGGGAAALALLMLSYRYLSEPIADTPAVSGPLLLGVAGAMVAAFHATFFAEARWAPARDRRAPAGDEVRARAMSSAR